MQEELFESRSNRTVVIIIGLIVAGVIGYLMYLSIAAAKANKFMADMQLNALQANLQQSNQHSVVANGSAGVQDIPVFPNTRNGQNK